MDKDSVIELFLFFVYCVFVFFFDTFPCLAKIYRAEKQTGADIQRLVETRAFCRELRIYSASSQQKCPFVLGTCLLRHFKVIT